jgi:pimeloyl-ACP methyl ester carboxylesterase
MKTELAFVATQVDGAVITNTGHWIMEEQPKQAIAILTAWLAKK